MENIKGPMGGLMGEKVQKAQNDVEEGKIIETNAVPIKGLPKSLQSYYNDFEMIRNPDITTEDKQNLVKIYGKNSKEWTQPRSQIAREFALDMILYQLHDAKNQRVGTFINLPDKSIRWIIKEAQEIFKKEPTLLEIEGPIRVTGDFHGQFYDMLRLFEISGGGLPKNKFLLMGDFVDRGKQGIEVMCLLLAYKVKYPDKIFLLRGNHECSSITRMYGFYDECKRRYGLPLWRDFCTMFNYLPISAIIDERILCMHGGLSPDLHHLS